MVPLRRRRLLQAATAATAGLAGCEGLEATTGTSDEPAVNRDVSPGTRLDPTYALLRRRGTRPLAWLGDDRPTTNRGRRPSLGLHDTVVGSRDRADQLTIADVEGADSARRFVDETDFQTSAIYLEHLSLGACYRGELCKISWGETDVDVHYGRRSLPYDEPCEVDEYVMEARFVRLPTPLTDDQFTSHSVSLDGSPCRTEPQPDAGVTATEDES